MDTVTNTAAELMSWLYGAIPNITDEEDNLHSDLLESYVQARVARALEEHIRNG